MGLVRRMSCFSCCCLHSPPSPVEESHGSAPLGGGTARRGRREGSRRLVVTGSRDDDDDAAWEEEEDFTSATSRAEMDIALLRKQYRWTKEKQMRENRVIVFRRGEWGVHSAYYLLRCAVLTKKVVGRFGIDYFLAVSPEPPSEEKGIKEYISPVRHVKSNFLKFISYEI